MENTRFNSPVFCVSSVWYGLMIVMSVMMLTCRADGQNYQVARIGSIDNVYALGLNNSDHVTGYVKHNGSWTTTYAFLWTRENGFRSIGGYMGHEINDHGQIAGQVNSLCAGVWENGAWISQDNRQTASAINESGQITGLISSQPYINPGPFAPYRDDDIHTYGFTTLSKPNTGAGDGFDINNLGQSVASCGTGGVFYDAGGEWHILNSGGYYTSQPYSINDHGLIVGYGRATLNSSTMAIYWDRYSGAMQQMGSLGSGHSLAYELNNSGQAVGESCGHAFLWSKEEGMLDLNSLISPQLGITLVRAMDINENGSIIAEGTNAQGIVGSYLLTIPEPATLLLLGLGAIVLRRKK